MNTANNIREQLKSISSSPSFKSFDKIARETGLDKTKVWRQCNGTSKALCYDTVLALHNAGYINIGLEESGAIVREKVVLKYVSLEDWELKTVLDAFNTYLNIKPDTAKNMGSIWEKIKSGKEHK